MNIELDNIEVDVNNILLKNELLKKRETLFNIGIDFSSISMLKGDKKILASDSSTFDKYQFPKNYINHIKSNIGDADIILVSSHKEVRDALQNQGIEFTLVYPSRDIKEEYIQRYIDRGNDDKFVELLKKNWENWMTELEEQKGCNKIELKNGQYLSDIINKL